MTDDLRAVLLAYGGATAVAVATLLALPGDSPITNALWADLAATLAIFACSWLYSNSSFYDAYWSVAPPLIALYWWAGGEPAHGSELRRVLVFALVLVWALRLTWNWVRGWQGLRHEDWRYVGLRESSGRAYWPVSLLGIHGMPTLVVFLGCLPLYAVLASNARPIGALDVLALAVTGGAIWLEARADRELLEFRRARPGPQEILRSGVWAHSRHPNYLGEMGFWWGLYLFGLAADPAAWWTGAGAVVITGLFQLVSLPMIETRMRERRPGYVDWAQRTPRVLPRLWRAAGGQSAPD